MMSLLFGTGKEPRAKLENFFFYTQTRRLAYTKTPYREKSLAGPGSPLSLSFSFDPKLNKTNSGILNSTKYHREMFQDKN